MLLTAKGLEQATDGRVAVWRAAHFARLFAPGERVWDVTCGLGAEALALADAGLAVVAADLDPDLARIAAWNLGATALAADATAPPWREPPAAVLLDPDRRPQAGAHDRGRAGGGRRRLDPDAFAPSRETWPALLRGVRGAVIKLPPGLTPDAFPGPWTAELGPHRWVWVEAGGELRELGLWTGACAQAFPPPGAHVAVRIHGASYPAEPPHADVLSGTPQPLAAPLAEPPTHIIEVRPSARRAGLDALAVPPGAVPLDADASYFATAHATPQPTPFTECFRVLDSSPLDPRQARKLLRAADVGPLTIKKRGLELSSAQIAAKLGHKPRAGSRPGLLIAAPTVNGRRLFLVERL